MIRHDAVVPESGRLRELSLGCGRRLWPISGQSMLAKEISLLIEQSPLKMVDETQAPAFYHLPDVRKTITPH